MDQVPDKSEQGHPCRAITRIGRTRLLLGPLVGVCVLAIVAPRIRDRYERWRTPSIAGGTYALEDDPEYNLYRGRWEEMEPVMASLQEVKTKTPEKFTTEMAERYATASRGLDEAYQGAIRMFEWEYWHGPTILCEVLERYRRHLTATGRAVKAQEVEERLQSIRARAGDL